MSPNSTLRFLLGATVASILLPGCGGGGDEPPAPITLAPGFYSGVANGTFVYAGAGSSFSNAAAIAIVSSAGTVVSDSFLSADLFYRLAVDSSASAPVANSSRLTSSNGTVEGSTTVTRSRTLDLAFSGPDVSYSARLTPLKLPTLGKTYEVTEGVYSGELYTVTNGVNPSGTGIPVESGRVSGFVQNRILFGRIDTSSARGLALTMPLQEGGAVSYATVSRGFGETYLEDPHWSSDGKTFTFTYGNGISTDSTTVVRLTRTGDLPASP